MTVNSTRIKLKFFLISFFLIICMLVIFPLHRMTSEEKVDNPGRCPYYISMQALLSNYPAFAQDKANIWYLKQRLVNFERDIAKSKALLYLIQDYRMNYYQVLNHFGVKSIKEMTNPDNIMSMATLSYPIIDSFYLDSHVSCINPLLFPFSGSKHRRILQFNLGSLYDSIPNRFSRILVALPVDAQLGVFPGFFVNNQTTTLETQFMTGMPMLSALYVLPTYDYAHVGSYQTPVPWAYFNVKMISNPLVRKLYDIAGIDIFTVLQSDLVKNHMKSLPNTQELSSKLRPIFQYGDQFKTYLNSHSYGMAYLAQNIHYEDPMMVKSYEQAIKNYFAQPISHNPKEFTQVIDILYQKLLGLTGIYDIILEAKSPERLERTANESNGSVVIKNIIGERAFLQSNCLQKECTLVFNIAQAPGWHAYVNGIASSVNRANFAFMATNVPKGTANVWFIYAPIPALISYFVSMISLILIFMQSIKTRKN